MDNIMTFIFALWTCLVIDVKSAKISKDVIGFPEVEENVLLVNKQNRRPVYLPSMCGVNELYYPGDQKDDWICDCRPSYLYHPPTAACWAAYRRGPCLSDEYLVLNPLSAVIPVCRKNPCMDGAVVWHGRCEVLGSMDPCRHVFPSTLWVNATTLMIECVPLSFDDRFTSDTGEGCLPGCKRSIENKCLPLIKQIV